MNPHIILAAVLALTSLSSIAVTDRDYFIAELSAKPKFEVFNDGQNTYLEAVAGLVVTGATVDGDRYIVSGVPIRIRGFINGRPITVTRGVPPSFRPLPADPGAATARPVIGAPIGSHIAAGEVPTAGDAASTVTDTDVAMHVVPVEQWEIKPGASLRYTLDSWCEKAGYRLLWNVDGGFKSQGGHVVDGSFKKAVTELFAAIPQDLHLNVEITKNKLVIVTKGDK